MMVCYFDKCCVIILVFIGYGRSMKADYCRTIDYQHKLMPK